MNSVEFSAPTFCPLPLGGRVGERDSAHELNLAVTQPPSRPAPRLSPGQALPLRGEGNKTEFVQWT